MSRLFENLLLGAAAAAAFYAFVQTLRGNQVLAATAPDGGPVAPSSLGLLPLSFQPLGTGTAPGFSFTPGTGSVFGGGGTSSPTPSPQPAPVNPEFAQPGGAFTELTVTRPSNLDELIAGGFGQGAGTSFDPSGTFGSFDPVSSAPLPPVSGSSTGIAPVPRAKPSGISEDQDVMARTIYGEASSEGRAGREAVASVIVNRMRSPRWPSSAKAVCHRGGKVNGVFHYQFSCWNTFDPNRARIEALDAANPNPIFRECLDIARRALAGQLADNTGGADHYYADYIAKPYWAQTNVSPNATVTARIGRHIFMRGIA